MNLWIATLPEPVIGNKTNYYFLDKAKSERTAKSVLREKLKKLSPTFKRLPNGTEVQCIENPLSLL